MNLKFQCDANFKKKIVDGLLRLDPRIDIRTAADTGLRGVPDAKVLEAATEQGRILLTHDRRTMPSHFARFIRDRDCAGGIIVAQLKMLQPERRSKKFT